MAIITRWRMPPGKLVRIIVQAGGRIGNADQFQHFHRPEIGFFLVHPQVKPQRLGDLTPDTSAPD